MLITKGLEWCPVVTADSGERCERPPLRTMVILIYAGSCCSTWTKVLLAMFWSIWRFLYSWIGNGITKMDLFEYFQTSKRIRFQFSIIRIGMINASVLLGFLKCCWVFLNVVWGLVVVAKKRRHILIFCSYRKTRRGGANMMAKPVVLCKVTHMSLAYLYVSWCFYLYTNAVMLITKPAPFLGNQIKWSCVSWFFFQQSILDQIVVWISEWYKY